MKDQDKSRQELLDELADLRRRVAETEANKALPGPLHNSADEGGECYRSFLQDFKGLAFRGKIGYRPTLLAGAVEEITGYSADEFLEGTVHVDRMIHPDDLPGLEATQVSLRTVPGYGTEREYRIVRKDGQIRWVREVLHNLGADHGVPTGVQGFLYDITPLKEAEYALREREQRAELILGAAGLGIHECDTEGRVTFVNLSEERISGYTAEELLGSHIWDHFEPGPAKDALRAYLKHLVVEQPPTTPYYARRVRKNGELYDIRVDWSYKRDPQGRLVGFVTIVTDITDQKRAEAALRNSEDRYRSLAEATTDIVYIVSPRGTLLYANRVAARYIGISPAALEGKGQQDLFPAEMAQRHKERLQRVVETGEPGEIDELFRFGQQDVWLNVRSVPLRDEQGRVTAVMGVCRDITSRKRAEEALRRAHEELERRVKERTGELAKANEELQVLYDGMVDGLVVFDVQTVRVVKANPVICQTLGFSEDEMKLQTPEQRHPAEAQAFLQTHFEAVVQGANCGCSDVPVFTKDGGIRYFDSSSRRIDYNGRPCLLIFLHDVTDRKQARDALEREKKTLKHLLQSSDHERQLIAYEIHDGLAQHLAGAVMQFEGFDHLKEIKPRRAADAFHAGMTMLRQGHSEARRLISGVRPPILDEAGIVAAVSHLVNEMRRRKGPRIEYASDIEFDRLTPILENAVYRITQEALNNAFRHSQTNRIRVELVQHADRLRVEVQDWGVGFQPEQIEESRFGVAGIRERARLLGGSAVIDSRPGQGTRVVAEFPVVLRSTEE